MDDVGSEMQKLEQTYLDSNPFTSDYSIVQKISKIHMNFSSTMRMLEMLSTMHSKLDDIENMMQEDGEDIVGQMPNLLPAHYLLSQLQNFREQALYQTRNKLSVQRTLQRYFERLDKVLETFNGRLWAISRSMLDILRVENHTLVIKIAKIIEAEEQADEKSRAVRLAQETFGKYTSRLKAIKGDPHTPRDFLKQFNENMDETIKAMFEHYVDSKGEDLIGMLEGLDWMYADLVLIRDELLPRVPPSWNLFERYVGVYHNMVCELLKNIMASEPDAATLLKLYGWIKQYKLHLKNDVGYPYARLERKLLDGKEDSLIEDYASIIVRKVEEWMTNMSNTEANDFIERSDAPEVDADGLYGLQSAIIMFEMVNQQVDVAADSGQGRVLSQVVSEIVRAIKKWQTDWTDLLSQELQKQIENPESVPGGLVEYTIALANDQIRSADYTESLQSRLTPMVSKKYADTIAEELTQATDGFLNVAKQCLSGLLKMVFNDVRTPYSTIFTMQWYGGNEMSLIVDTFKEYVADCRLTLNSTLLELLMEDLLDNFLKEYILVLRNKNIKFRSPAALDQIFDDVEKAVGFFREYIDMSEIETQFDVLENIRRVLASSSETFPSEHASFLSTYWDTPAWVFESLIKNRDDLDSLSQKKMLETVRSHTTQPGELPTLMGQLQLR